MRACCTPPYVAIRTHSLSPTPAARARCLVRPMLSSPFAFDACSLRSSEYRYSAGTCLRQIIPRVCMSNDKVRGMYMRFGGASFIEIESFRSLSDCCTSHNSRPNKELDNK